MSLVFRLLPFTFSLLGKCIEYFFYQELEI
jgi:hypothetical protein